MESKRLVKNTVSVLKVVIIVLIVKIFLSIGATLKNDDSFFEGFDNLIGWKIYDYEMNYKGNLSTEISLIEDGYEGKAVLISGDILNDARIYKGIEVEPNSYYRLSVMVKALTSREGKGANISAMYCNESYDLKDIYNDWEECTIYLKTLENQNEIKFSLGLGGYSSVSSGYVYYDNFTLEKLEKLPNDVSVISFENSEELIEKEKKKDEVEQKFIFIIIASIIFLFSFYTMKKNKLS